ncbi:MAG TPA: hypothetical protein VNY05_46235 [Candidatus Acidoferrales bacterium]|nr:hypothetical protein [Candidatus Acidoferrales bacterium]
MSAEDHETIQQLLKRVQYLEEQLSELRAQRAATPVVPDDSAKSAGAVVKAEIQAQPAENPRPQLSTATPDAMAHEAPSGLPAMQIRGFGDLQYAADDKKGATNSFALGEFNLFITSKLSERVSILAEAVVAASQNLGPRPINVSNQQTIDLERLQLQYAASDYLNLTFGRYHTAIGFYNTAYHHSTWLQTAVNRPTVFAFEDDGGILPIHNVGVSASGHIPSGPLGLRYVAEIANGLASNSLDEPVQNIRDDNNGKAVNFAIMARPAWVPGFQAGFSVYRDELTPPVVPKIGETILAAHAVWQTPKWELLNEGILIRHAQTDRVVRTTAFYTQASRQFGKVRPYFRYQYLNVPATDPVLSGIGLLYGPSLGIRYDFSEFAAFKIQYDRTDRRALSGFNGVTTQLSFVF